MELTLAESVLLIALADAKGSTGFTPIDPGLAGALLVDLGRLDAPQRKGKELPPVEVTIAHPVLARTYGVIAASRKPRSAKAWVGRLPRDLKPLSGTVASQLVERGILTEQRSKMFGLFPRTRFPEANPEPERMLRSQLRDVLFGTRAPGQDDALLLGLLEPLGLLDRLVERSARRAAHQRAKQIADAGIAGSAVADTVREINAAVIAAAVASTVATGF